MLSNGVKLRINIIYQLDTDYVMVKKKSISAVANTIKQLHIQKDMHMIYKQGLYKNKQKEIDDLFPEYLVSVMADLDYPALVEEWKQNPDTAANQKN